MAKKPKARAKSAPPALAAADPTKPELLLEGEVMARCRVKSRAQLFKLERKGLFPKRKRYGMRRVAWPACDVDEWIAIGADAWKARHDRPAGASA